MADVLLATDDPRFPPYLRLYVAEIRGICEHSPDTFRKLAACVGKSKESTWYTTYAMDVLENPATVLKEVAKKPGKYADMGVPKLRRMRNGGGVDEIMKREREIEKRIEEEAPKLRERVVSTLIFGILRSADSIKMLDEILRKDHFALWQQVHLCGVKPTSDPVQVFFERFYREPSTLDKVSCCFGNLNFLPALANKYKGFAMYPILEPTVDVRNKVKQFLRNIPRVDVEGDDWFFEFLEVCDNDPEDNNAAALFALLPDYEDVLYEKNMKRRKERDEKRNLGRREEMADEEDLMEMRDKADYETYVETPRYGDQNKELILRDYQEELVAPAIQGKNTIVVAPTGAGKTEVCIFVAKHHIETREAAGKKSRVVMVVPKVPLVDQQEQRFREHFKGTHIVNGFHGDLTIRGFARQKVFLGSDIIIMTAEILRNMLRSVRAEERLYMADISLIILDEVHHCNKEHVYKKLMDSITSYKVEELKPQVLGLTATPLPNAQTTVQSSLEAIYKLMADCNCFTLSTVVRNIESLEQHVPKPDEEFHKLNPPKKTDDSFGYSLGMIANKICERIKEIRKELRTSRTGTQLKPNEELTCYGGAPGPFLAKVNAFREALNRLSNPLKKKPLIACDFFIAIGTALSMNELLPSHYALEFLEEEMQRVRQKFAASEVQDFVKCYEESLMDLKDGVEKEEESDRKNATKKPIVAKLLEVLQVNFEEKPESQCIIFVAERSTARNLSDFLNRKGVLGSNQVGFVTSSKAGTGQTAQQQADALKAFKQKKLKCVVSTSVLDEGLDVGSCNLIIKYNTGSSAVSKIQRAGRARARNSKSVFLCLHDGIAESEYMAIVTGNMMRKCVAQMMQVGERNVRRAIEGYMTMRKKEAERLKAINAKLEHELKGNEYEVVCRLTNHYICSSDNIRVEGSHYVVADPDIWKRLTIQLTSKTRAVDVETMMLGSVNCAGDVSVSELDDYNRSCSCVGKLFKLAGAYFPHLRANEVMLRKKQKLHEEEEETKGFKSWSKVGEDSFYIQPLTDADIRLMLNALNESDSEAQAIMMEKLDALVEKLGADVARNADKKRQERERREMMKHKKKDDYFDFCADDDQEEEKADEEARRKKQEKDDFISDESEDYDDE